jgi:LemA protein
MMSLGLEIIIGAAVLLIALAFVGYFVVVYNSLVRLKNNIKKAWGNIDVLLKQRSDELPKLIETVKGYMKYEKNVLTNVTKARTSLMKARSLPEKAKADGQLTAALKTLFAVAENYPKLEANASFIQLQGRISGLENELADRREFYNDSANEYNIRIQSFPDMIVARMLGYVTPTEMFKATEAEKKDVKVKF